MRKKIEFKILIIALIITLLQSYCGLFSYFVFADETSNEHTETVTHNNFTEVIIREESEFGAEIANILNGDQLNLEMGKDYYACIKLQTPFGSNDGYFTAQIGDSKPNGIQFINIPGQTYTTGAINSDAFDSLTSFTPIADPTYGSNSTKYAMVDGTLKYHIKEAKMNNNEIYMAFGFKIDDSYWNNNMQTMKNFFKIEVGNSEGVQDSLGISAKVNNEKKFYMSFNTNQREVRAGVETTPLNYTFASSTNSPMLYEKVSYTVTYPKGCKITDISLSTSVKSMLKTDQRGFLEMTEEVDNGDGTVSRTIIQRDGTKLADGINNHVNICFEFDKSFKDGTVTNVVISDAYYIPEGETEKFPVYFNTACTQDTLNLPYKVLNSDEIIEKIRINPIHRTSSSCGEVYNWNIDRDEDNLLQTAQMLCGANIQNYDTVATAYDKTVKATFNITNENININMVTVPVGYNDDGSRKTISEIRYTGYDADGNLVSGTATSNKIRVSEKSPYTVYSASDLGIVSFKTVESDIGKMCAGQYTSSWSTYGEYTSNLFAAFGYCTTSEIGTRMKCTYEIENTDKTLPDSNMKVTTYTDITGTPQASYISNITNGYTKENLSIVAGNSVTLGNRTLDIYANFSNNATNGVTTSLIVNPVVILTLPKGISFSDLSFSKRVNNETFKQNVGTYPLEFDVENISYLNTSNDGTNIYRITFRDRDLIIGRSTNDHADNTQLYITITYNTTKNVTTQVYDMNDLIQVTGETPVKASQYANNTVPMKDIYGVNDGLPLGGVRYKSNTVTGLSLQRLDSITVDNAISISKIDGVEVEQATRTWDTYDSSNQNSIAYIGLNTEGQYRLHVQNPSSSEAESLRMILPIPKEGVDLGTAFTQGSNTFDMTLVPTNLAGYSHQYITVDSTAVNTCFTSIRYTQATQETANAILITKDIVDAGADDYLYFDFVVNNDTTVQNKDFNVFRNNFEYILDNEEHVGSGNYVAVEVATCRIEGTVFNDSNLNNRKDGTEARIENISVVATDSLGRVQFAKTDDAGYYVFENVREDDVKIEMEIKEGAYKFNGTLVENNGDVFNNVTPSTNAKKASTTVHASGTAVQVNASVNDVYTVTYDKGAGNGTAPATKEYVLGEEAIIATPPSGMNVTGGEFLGWSTTKLGVSDDNDTKVEYRPGDVITVTENTTLYAVYKKKNIKITFDYRGGGVYTEVDGKMVNTGMDYKYVKNGQQYRAKDADGKEFPPNPTKEGWKFIKWELPNATYSLGSYIAGTTTVNIEEDTVIRAVWIKLNKEEGTINTTVLNETTVEKPFLMISDGLKVIDLDTSAIYGYKYELASGATLPEGMFLDSETGSIYGKPTETFDGDVRIMIKVLNNSAKTTFYDFYYIAHIHVTPNQVIIKNDIEPKGSILLEDGAGTLTIKSEITGLLDEKELNEGNQITYVTIDEKGVETTIGTATIVEGKVSIDWNVTSSEVGVYKIVVRAGTVNDEYEVIANNAINSYIITEEELANYIITFDSNGYEFENEERVRAEKSQYGELPEHRIHGYAFDGWYDSTADNANKINETDVVTSDITVYAKYTAKEYTVNYNTEIETTINSKTNVKYNDSDLIPSTTLTKTGYEFKGWYIGNTKVEDTSKYKDLVASDSVEEITLSASWKAKEFFVRIDTDGGSMSTSEMRATYDSAYGEIEKPSRVGYNFIGWTDEDGNTVTKDTIYKYTKDTVLKANWSPKAGYTINYNTDGGTEIPSKYATWETVALDGIENPTREGSDFLYWSYQGKEVSATDTYATISKNDKYESITLNAVWDTHKYIVTLDEGTGFEVVNLDRVENVAHGGNYVFEVKFEPGYIKGDDFKVTVNGEEVALDENNQYVISNITENKVVRVSGVVDDRKATGAIKIEEDEWIEPVFSIDYDRAYNTEKQAILSGKYAYGEDPIVEYHVDVNPEGLKDYELLNWKTYTEPITLSLNAKYIVYEKITSSNGAVVYINSNGVIIDSEDPEIEGLEDGKSYCLDQTINVSDNLSGIAKVEANNKTIVANDDGSYTISAEGTVELVVTDNAGNSTSIIVEIYAEHPKAETGRTEPTCTVDGEVDYACEVCKKEFVETIDKLGHDFGEWFDVEDSTLANAQLQRRECSRCDAFEEQLILHEHNTSGETKIEKEPTCTETGIKGIYCECGRKADEEVIPANGHTWGNWKIVTEPTEDEQGLEQRKCEVCDAVEENILGIEGHVHVFDKEHKDEPTCTEDGVEYKYCECGAKNEESIKVTDELKATGHSYGNWETVTDPSELEEGIERKTCTVCGHVVERTIPKLEHRHSYDEVITNPTCTEDGEKHKECRCGHKIESEKIEALGHKLGDWVIVRQPTESTTGLKVRECRRCDLVEEEIIKKKPTEEKDDNYNVETNGVNNPSNQENKVSSDGSGSISGNASENVIDGIDAPKTGDDVIIYAVVAGLTCIVLILMSLVVFVRNKNEKE